VEGVRLRKRVAPPSTAAGSEPQEDDLPLAAAGSPLRLAYELKNLARWRDRKTRRTGCVPPVTNEADPLGLIEIELSADPLRRRGVRRADQALCVAKRRGRNRVMLYESLQDSPIFESKLSPTPEIEWF
jgi:hypothetical protein